ncbi:Exodeoxyribonuclease VII large subunit [Mesoplasma florum W37]|uniref:Exodeoxyribonuclease 7 large subunit n=1 Tax=Mesoplasma florum TaxID=2151 RepID=A0A2R3NXL7_MESFO|nr:exodeoxyribonuclease VII large subunit [Mesoplasma florum]AGY41417.1 Exodeoxyribonuclease VII large subunit [Mesoplasma florum W37]AVN58958.1 exodeoxyribonuclease VII large subunit [Mesoplasma florum]AVN59636.1 exodeoxyribonuclease VII large subunit [Mesoplasma florum]AVN65758.1 Exodeoxyribonuclease VII large subunit [Mesoplasma florum]
MENKIFSVAEISQIFKEAIEGSNYFKNIYVRGEVGNLTFNKSGHVYFSLKDNQSTIAAMIWKSNAHKLTNLNVKEGMEITCYGRLTYYVPSGRVSFEAVDVSVEGKGDLQEIFEERLKEITALGWTDESRKKPINRFAKNIGLITTDSGAAIKDLITTLKRRMPSVNIYLFPTMVQGETAKFDIANKIQQANLFEPKLDILIVGRGGGSYEDLWTFNEMEVLKAIVDSSIPVISAVGHEPDITLSDYVADLRAATPTAAAELASISTEELLKELAYNYENQIRLFKNVYNNQQLKIEEFKKQNILKINNKYDLQSLDLNYIEKSFINNINNIISRNEMFIENIESKTALLDPKKPLDKGFGLIMSKDKQIINSVDKVDINQEIKLVLKDGEIETIIKGVKKHGK